MAEDQQAEATSNIAIKQMNLAYHPPEDRLLLKLGLTDQSELQLWLSYRVTRVLWAYLNEDSKLPTEASSHQAESPQQAVEQFEEEAKAVETLNQLDFTTEYNQSDYQTKTHTVKDVESGQEKELSGALLAVEAEKQGESLNAMIVFTCANGFNLNLNLNEELTMAMITMLQMAAKEAAWPLDGAVQKPSPTVVIKEEENQTVH